LKPHVDSGKFVALGVTSLTESRILPNVKTIASQDFPGFEFTGWNAMFVPRGTPPAIIARLNAALKKIQATPEMQEKQIALGFDPTPVGEPDELAAFVRSEHDKWGRIIREANITPN